MMDGMYDGHKEGVGQLWHDHPDDGTLTGDVAPLPERVGLRVENVCSLKSVQYPVKATNLARMARRPGRYHTY